MAIQKYTWADVTPKGLFITYRTPSIEQWFELVEGVLDLGQAHQWSLGDAWINRDHLGDEVIDRLRGSRVSLGTMRTYAWVARSWPYDERRDDVHFIHHQILASLDRERRLYWINRCAAEDLTDDELRFLTAEERGAEFGDEGAIPSINALFKYHDRVKKQVDNLPAIDERFQVEKALNWLNKSLHTMADALKRKDTDQDKAA